MIKTYTAYTNEVDDIEAAIEQIKEQVSFDNLLAHSVAVVSCYADFIDSGVYSGICDFLPFDVVGSTTLATIVRECDDDIALTLMIMTSDDVSFATGLSLPITEENDNAIRGSYEKAVGELGMSPSLILSYTPLVMNVGGDYFVKALDDISGRVPNFGTIAIDHNEDYHQSEVLYNGQSYADRYAFILLGGNINPKYYIASISNEKVFQEKGVVTASKGNQLQTVNNVPVADYLEGLGLTKNEDGSISGINSFPFIMDLNDGMMPIVRVMFAITPEGYAVCGGDMPVGASLFVGSIDLDEVISTTDAKLKEVLSDGDHSCLLIYSCVGRYFSLGYNPTGEMDRVKSILDNTDIPYHFTYSGGEICPVYSHQEKDKTMNRNHNDTLIVCAL